MSRRLVSSAIVCVLALAGSLATAQDTGMAPKPGPEHEKLGYFVGKWTAEGQVADNPFMPGGKVVSHDDCTWFEGGFAVVCHSEGTGPMGAMKGLGIMAYSAEDKAYTYYGVDNFGMAMSTIPFGTIDGDTWTFDDETKMGGVAVKSRYVMKQLSPTSYTFKWEMQDPDGSWKTVMDGTSTRAQ